MSKISKKLFLLPFLSAGIALGVMSAQAQQAEGNAKASGWFKTCDEQGANKVCNVQFRVITNAGQVVTSLNLVEVTGEIKRRVFRIIVPTGRSLPPGIQVQVDGKRAVAIPYTYCRPRVCGAEVALDDKLVGIFKAGGKLDVTTINFQGRQNPVPITLKGFTAAYDGPPVKREDLAARQEELKKQLEQKVGGNSNSEQQ